MRAVALLVIALASAGCASTHVSNARFVTRSPSGGIVATPSAEVGMDDANGMIAAHCGAGGYSITREGESLVGNTVVTEGANSVDAQSTEGAGQLQGHDSSKTVFATGSNWQVHYTCNDPGTVNMGLITRTRTEPSRLAWGGDVGGGLMVIKGHSMDSNPRYEATRSGSGTALSGNGWVGYRLSDKFALGGGFGVTQVVATPEWKTEYVSGAGNVLMGFEQDAKALEFFATANYMVGPRVDMRVRIGVSKWDNVDVDGSTPFASAQLGYRVVDVAADSGVYVSVGVSSYFSSMLSNNVTPALLIGFH